MRKPSLLLVTQFPPPDSCGAPVAPSPVSPLDLNTRLKQRLTAGRSAGRVLATSLRCLAAGDTPGRKDSRTSFSISERGRTNALPPTGLHHTLSGGKGRVRKRELQNAGGNKALVHNVTPANRKRRLPLEPLPSLGSPGHRGPTPPPPKHAGGYFCVPCQGHSSCCFFQSRM